MISGRSVEAAFTNWNKIGVPGCSVPGSSVARCEIPNVTASEGLPSVYDLCLVSSLQILANCNGYFYANGIMSGIFKCLNYLIKAKDLL